MQERNGYFFCIEDRALYCKHCDVSTHIGSPFASSHRRFIITGVKVALQPSINSDPNVIICSPSSTTSSNFPAHNESRPATAPMNVEDALTESRATFSGAELDDPFAIGPSSNCLLNEMFDPNDFNCYEFSEVGSSRISSSTPP